MEVAAPATIFRSLLDEHPSPVLLVGSDRRIVYSNPAARREIGADAVYCCDVVCGSACLTRAVRRGGQPRETTVAGAGDRRWSVTAAPLPDTQAVAVYLRSPDAAVEGEAAPLLGVDVLGPMRIRRGERPIHGAWLTHRPGQVFKYLVAHRGRVVTVDELLDALWPGSGASAIASVRQAVHTLRGQLDPGRREPASPRYLTSHRGGYSLNQQLLQVDVDVFERQAHAGMEAAERGDVEQAAIMLSRAAERYRGDFLQEDPFAEWALVERERVRSLAGRVLKLLAEVKLEAGELRDANERLERLAEMEPLDLSTQRDLLSVMLQRGRHSEAVRRYELVRHRYRRAFGHEPGFDLAELTPRG